MSQECECPRNCSSNLHHLAAVSRCWGLQIERKVAYREIRKREGEARNRVERPDLPQLRPLLTCCKLWLATEPGQSE